jgi:DHA1 family tetracycline resistance protein-like MFS transporter
MSLNSNKIRSGTLSHAPLSPPLNLIGSSIQTKERNGNVIGASNTSSSSGHNSKSLNHLYVLPVLLLEFLALALTRAVIPTLLLQTFGDNVYFVMGCAECVRGLLAFVACPMFGKISDVVGRKGCLFVTVLGTCAPVCSLAILTWRDYEVGGSYSNPMNGTGNDFNDKSVETRMWIFVFLLALSGIFSSTFTLTFAYISDTVKRKKDRVSAYGLALATFGLSFTIGPLAGGYLAHVQDNNTMPNAMGDVDFESEESTSTAIDDEYTYLHPLGQKRVFSTALVLTIIDLLYIYFILPESISLSKMNGIRSPPSSPRRPVNPHLEGDDDEYDENMSVGTNDTRASFSEQWNHIRQDVLPNAWSPLDTLRIFSGDPFMYEVGCIALLYYTSLWAVVSTLMLYAAKRFKLGPERLGELMSALGLSTMISEAVLVRMIVPSIGEKKSMQLGLAAFFLQCVVLGFAYEGWQLFICVLFSMVANLVYPSLTSLVSSAVAPDMVGEALGAVNGVKALTEGLGPLVFGTLMTISEKSALPGWPYLIASIFAIVAYKRSANLPDEEDEEYISERYLPNRSNKRESNYGDGSKKDGYLSQFTNRFIPNRDIKKSSALSEIQMKEIQGKEDEYVGLLSEVEEMDEDDLVKINYNSDSI